MSTTSRRDHPAGTFWYHTHRHGSTALQVSSGMAGALIIRGNRLPTPTTHGDIDTLLDSRRRADPRADPGVAANPVRLPRQGGHIKVQTEPIPTRIGRSGSAIPATSGSSRLMTTATSSVPAFGQAWAASGRYTTHQRPGVGDAPNAQAGRLERWRMIHGGVRDTITLQFCASARRRRPAPGRLRAAAAKALSTTDCTGAPLPYHLVAADGLTMAAATRATVAVLQPGYRWDALVVFPEDGDYCIIDVGSDPTSNVNQNIQPTQLLGTVRSPAARR